MAYARLLFGPTHRYGTGAVGTAATIKSFTASDLKAFHAAAYQPGNATVIVVGDLTADSVMPQLEKVFGSWRAGATALHHTTVPMAPQPTQRQIVIVDMPGAAQSQVRIGWVGVPRSTPDFFPLQVLNTILGGSFTSRLNQNLRETHGYSYGASSRFDMRQSAGPFFAGAGVQTDKTSEALREFFNELTAIGKPVPADELTKAKNYIAFGFPSNFETIGDFSAQMEQLLVYGLPESYYADYVKNIQAVTADAVLKMAATYIQPQRFLVVVVGDRKVIEPGIRALNLGMVRTMSVQEALGE
jgi:predicted Zn-dependent peptidase